MKRTQCCNATAIFKFCSTRFLVLFLIFFIACNPAKALITNYTFESTSGSYVPLAGGTTYLTGSAWDDGVSSLIQMPFAFNYNNLSYTTLSINANGFITMGATSSSTTYCGLQQSTANSIAGYGADLRAASAGSSIQYGVMGVAPNRQFVIQWTDCRQFFSATTNHWSFQIILNETSNEVQVVMGTITSTTTLGANNCADVAGESGDVGLLGNSTQDFNLRSVTNGTDTWATSGTGIAINAVCNLSSTNFPASGLTYTWTPGPALPMVYVSSTTSFVNNTGRIPRNTSNNAVIKVQVVTTGSSSALNVTNLNLSTTGSTNPLADITNIKVFFTGASNTFSTASQFGTNITGANGSYSVSGSAILSEGINYFWVTYSISATATFGNILSGCCSQVTGSGSMGIQTPAVTCPAGSQTIIDEGVWTPVAATAPHDNHGVMLLLSDGSVICHSNAGGADGNGTLWDKLTPDIHGSYINGTWSTTAPMNDTRLFFSSQVLKDGRVYVGGGEYGTGGAKAEIYDPLTNVWTAAPAPGVTLSDANSEILEDGRILQAVVDGGVSPFLRTTKIYNPSNNTYVTGPTTNGIHNESVWVKLPDNSILFIDRLSTNSERYIPATNTWITDATVPINLYDPFGDETGAGILLPDGRAFFIGSQGTTAFYTPSGNAAPGSWSVGPVLPNSTGAPDAPMAMMANGKVLCAVSPGPTSTGTQFIPPTYFYEFDYLTNSFTLIHAPGEVASLNIACYQTTFLDLPDGSVLYAQNQSNSSSQYYIYTPTGSPIAAGKPTISSITQTSCTSFQIDGTQFNGISQGASYGDDWQMSTNYPVIRLTNGSNVYYCRTFNWNSTGVKRGNQPDNAQFTLPAGLPIATYQLVVTANGIASDPVSFTPTPYLTSTLTAPATCSNIAFSYVPVIAPAGSTYSWTRAAITGISNAAVVIPQTSNPNEVLINTTSSPVTVLYDFTITSNGCSNTQQVTVIVNPTPVPVISGNAAICIGNPITLDAGAGYTAYSWSNGAISQAVNISTAGLISVTVTDGNGCIGSDAVTTSIASYTITGTAGLNGSISENGSTEVICGTNQVYTINASPCYQIADVLVDGVSQGAVSTYTFTNVHVAHTISASFSQITYNITSGAGANGIISPNGITNVNCNGSQTYIITPDGGSVIQDVIVDNVSQGAIFQYTFSNVSASHTINVTFSQSTYSITSSSGSNGSISPSGTILVNSGSNEIYNISANSCYHIADVIVDGISQGAISTYTFANVTSVHSISATFALNAAFPVPGPFAGPSNVCPYVGNSTPVTYSIPVIPGATSYNWVLPANTNLISGAGTNTITVTFAVGFTQQANKQIRVTALSSCGNSPLAILYLNSQLPGTPSPFSGNTSVCGFLGSGSITYSIPPVLGATSYVWTTQSGTTNITFPNGTGENGYTVNVAFTNAYTTNAITVQAVNACGISGARSITVTRTSPFTPGPIAGPTNICANIAPNGNIASYSVSPKDGVTYEWTVPAGSIGLTGQGSNTISFMYPIGYSSGIFSVVASNDCGSSATRNLAVSKLNAATPGVIDVIETAFCPDRVYTYTLSTLPANATSVQWTIPAIPGVLLVSGQGSTSITVSYPPTAVQGNVTAQSINNCSASTIRSTAVRLPACAPTLIVKSDNYNFNQFSKTYEEKEISEMLDVKIYPNPSVSSFNIKVMTPAKEVINVRVFDEQGRFIKAFAALPFQIYSFGETFKAGVYLIEFKQGERIERKKLIKLTE
ncbi:MAG: BNR-repeat neuraminidase N-terminal domain-containing protein [Ferruginibacter sp.]